MTTDPFPSFADLLARHRRAAGLSQEALAERAGLSRAGISVLERGLRQSPHTDTVRLLADALGLAPTERDALSAARNRAASSVASLSSTIPPNNLRVPPTPLIGREREVASVCELLRRDDVRLLTLHGPAGVGKTRLALQVAGDVLNGFPDGIFVAPLARLRDPELVLTAIAHALGLREQGDRPLRETLNDYLRDKRLLLLLDNFEHLITAAPLLAELLALRPPLHLLVTSRTVLRVRGEHALLVPPLALPDATFPSSVATLAEVASVALFVQRAQAVSPDFHLSAGNAPAVATICQRLDGLPLAIELAAARSHLLPPQALLARLDRRLPLLEVGARDLPERQQTMRRTLQWSYDLLPTDVQALFRRLSVFVGGCTLEAVQEVCGAAGELATTILDGLAHLVDTNLLLREDAADGELRLGMLETMREFGRDELVASGEAETTERAYAEYYLALAESVRPKLTGPEQGRWLESLEEEHDNLRAVLRWSRESSRDDVGLRVAVALGQFWYMTGYTSEGRGWLEELLPRTTGEPRTRVTILHGASTLAFQQGDLHTAAVRAEEGLQIRRELGDPHGLVSDLNGLGNIVREQADYPRAIALYEESLVLARELGDTRSVSVALNNLGTTARHQGDYRRATVLHQEGLALRRDIGDTWGIANALGNLACVLCQQGDLARAEELGQESLILRRGLGDSHGTAISLDALGAVARLGGDLGLALARHEESRELFRKLGDEWGIAVALQSLAKVAWDGRDAGKAAELFAESLMLCHRINHRREIASCLEGLAATCHGRPQMAAYLFGAAAAIRRAINAPCPPDERAVYDRSVETARRDLGPEAFEAAWEVGAAAPLDRIIKEALE